VQLVAVAVIVVITVVSGRSADLALKLQVPIMAAVGLSMVALAAGVFSGSLQTPEWVATYRTAPEGFWYVFAVFFPAVTGFTAGIGMSGDLKDPRRSIPRGTLLAVLTGTVTYLSIPVLLAISARVSPEELAQPGVVWTRIAVHGAWLVFPGLWGAILSSAFGSVLGGPRVLQALAADGLAPRFLARLSRSGEPATATWISGGIALVAVALGGLNAVAQFVTILFLTLYVMINLSAGLERLASWFNQNRGIVTTCRPVEGDLAERSYERETVRREMDRVLERRGVVAFNEVDVVRDFESGVIDVTQANGIADLQCNTVMFGWPTKPGRLASQLRIMRAISNAGKSTIIARINWAHEPGQEKRIDLWWGGQQNNGDLMLLLAHLLRLNPEWQGARLLVRSIARSEEERQSQLESLAELIPETRIQADTEVILKPEGQSLIELMHAHSHDADVVFLGMKEPEVGSEADYAERLTVLAEGLKTAILVRNAGEWAGRLI